MNGKVTLSSVAVLNFLHGAELRNQTQSKPLEPLYGPTAFFACLSSILSSGLAKKDCSRLLRLGYLNGCASEIAVATLEQDAVRFAPQRHRADIRLASRYCNLSHIPRLKPVRR